MRSDSAPAAILGALRGRRTLQLGLVVAIATLGFAAVAMTGAASERPRSEVGSHTAVGPALEVSTTKAITEDAIAMVPTPVGSVLVAQATSSDVAAYQQPDDLSEPIVSLSNPTPRGGPLVFQAVGSEIAVDQEWLEVLLPIRPNGTTGWVRTMDIELSANPFRIEIDAERHLLELFESDRLYLSSSIGIGTGETPTPIGDFYIVELLEPPQADGAYGPYAFGLSGYSESLDSFAGGQGVIGIHGTNDPTSLGRDASHGCVRVANRTIEELATILPLGTPVRIADG